MRQSAFLPLAMLMVLGCASGSIDFPDEDDGNSGSTADGGSWGIGGDGGSDGGTGDGGASDGGTSDGGTSDGGASDGGGDGGDPVIDYTGVYMGAITTAVYSEWGDYDLGDCETTITVDADGAMAGGAECATGGWGGDTYEVPITGQVQDDGSIEGSSQLELGWSGTIDIDVTGQIDGDVMLVELDGELVSDWTSAEVVGDGELDKQ